MKEQLYLLTYSGDIHEDHVPLGVVTYSCLTHFLRLDDLKPLKEFPKGEWSVIGSNWIYPIKINGTIPRT